MNNGYRSGEIMKFVVLHVEWHIHLSFAPMAIFSVEVGTIMVNEVMEIRNLCYQNHIDCISRMT
jgi:hypothetical protein